MSRILSMGPKLLLQGAYTNLLSKNASKKLLTNTMASASTVAAKYQTSTASNLLSQPLIPSTEKSVKEISTALAEKMTALFKKAGIAQEPAVELSVDADSGKITVKGKRADIAKIESLINNDATVKELAQTLNAVSSQTYGLTEHAKFQKEYRATNNVEAVVAKYAALFAPQTSHTFSMRFNGNLQVLADGKTWRGSA